MQPTVITHADPDGIIALSLFYQNLMSFKCNVFLSSAYRLKDTLLTAIRRKFLNQLYIFDLTGSAQIVPLLLFFKNVVWIDHHIWPEIKKPENVEFFIDSKAKSATELVGKYFNIKSELIEIANEIDTNNIKSEKAQFLRNLIASIKWKYPADFNKLKNIAKVLAISGIERLERSKNTVQIINEYIEWIKNLEKDVLNKVYISNVNGKKIAIYESKGNVPVYVITDKLAEHKEWPFDIIAVLIKKDVEEKVISKVELRTNTNTDVYNIAASFGGGGHKTASSFTLPKAINAKELLKLLSVTQ